MDTFQAFSSNLGDIFWVIFFFGGSIFVHELGHFLAAKRRKLWVSRFSIGFGPRIFSKTIGKTEFCISLFPLGGYVVLPQLARIKELEESHAVPTDIPSISWVDKIITAVMGAIFNILFAFILAVILWKIGMKQPQSVMSNTIGNVRSEISLPHQEKVISPAQEAGLKIGDQIIAIDDRETHNFTDITYSIALGEKRDAQGPLSKITVLREGQRHDFIVRPVLVKQNRRSGELLRIIGIEPFQELCVANIYKKTPAERAGLQVGDKLLAMNGEKIFSYTQFNEILERNHEFQLTIERQKKVMTFPLYRKKLATIRPFLRITTDHGTFEALPIFTRHDAIVDPYRDECVLKLLSLAPELQKKFPQWRVGDLITHIQRQPVHNVAESSFMFQNATDDQVTLTLQHRDYRLSVKRAELLPAEQHCSIGVALCGTQVLVHKNPFSQIQQSAYWTLLTLKSLLSPESNVCFKNLMGPPGILDALHTVASYDLRLLLWKVMTLNVNLAIFNLLPIPIFDGGTIALVLLEKLFRRKVANYVLITLQLSCMLLFLGLALYVSFFDISRILERCDDEKNDQKQQQLVIDEQLLWNGLL
ncbi:MAG: RIP metalloprotease RseP [Puniceicoccales bacterium]|jgi:regulator of sigma E protease|nr:RIP metalloprotease RseP [Puniceicoccales bacterium]